MAYPSAAVVMAFYAGGAMPGEVQATHLLAVVEVVEDSRVRVGIPFRGGQYMNGIHDVRRGCIGKDTEILKHPGPASPGLPSPLDSHGLGGATP